MEMEDHTHQNQYGIDLRQFITGRATHFPIIPAHPPQASAEPFAPHRNLPPQGPHYEMMMLMPCGGGGGVGGGGGGGGLHEFRSDSSATACVNVAAAAANSANAIAVATATATTLSGLEGDGGTGRWPRQETLTLLEIRSRLDSKFKEANQKGPLWDEVSRIMCEEHGYQRSGKKCREKFENLYKYYKKTKEGKAGRQDGKHYRFFRQLEALYGETSNQVSAPETHFIGGFHATANASNAQVNQENNYPSQRICDSLSLSNTSELDTSSSEDNDMSTATLGENDSTEKRRKRRSGRNWKVKIKDFIDSQMRKLMERQEAWLEKLTKTLEQKEQERVLREEEWRKNETARIDREHKFWAKERAWIETRDAALMESLQKLTGREVNVSSPEIQSQRENQKGNGDETCNGKGNNWPESEVTKLIQIRTSMESRFQQSGCAQDVLWEEIASKMACLGYERSALMCKEKWSSANSYLRETKEGNKKRKENARSCCYFEGNNSDQSMYNPGGAYCEQPEAAVRLQLNDDASPVNSNAAANAVSDSCFRFLMADHGENLWENYGLKLNNVGGNHQNQ